MQNDLMDRSKYFRAMVVLIKKDLRISPKEKDFFLRMGQILQFSTEFCEEIINDLLKNPHIDEKPPVFSNTTIARIFLKDGIKMAFADKNLHQKEYNWLQKVSRANHIPDDWLLQQLFDFLNDPQKKKSKTLEIEKYYQQYQEISKSNHKLNQEK